jgi:hypothetical protein
LHAREAAGIASFRASGSTELELFAVPDLGREPTELADLARLGRTLAIL